MTPRIIWTNIGIHEDLWLEAKCFAAKSHLSLSVLIRQALRQYLNATKPLPMQDEIVIDLDGKIYPPSAQGFIEGLANLRQRS